MPTPKTMSKPAGAGNSAQLTDKDIITDVLGSEKTLMQLYNTGITESSCTKMRTLLSTKYSECAADQFDVFNYMSQHGLYPTEDAPAQKVTSAKTKFETTKQSMK